MAPQRIGGSVDRSTPPAAPQDHPWRGVLLVLIALVVVLAAVAIGVVAASSGMVGDIWQAVTSVFHQP